MDALKHHKRYVAMLTALSLLVSFVVPLILIEPADSMTGILVCNKAVHTHNAECYDGNDLICDIEEHIHTNECYKKFSLLSLKGSSSGTSHDDNIYVSNAGGGLNPDGSYNSDNAHEFADGTGWYNPAEVPLYTLLFGELDQEAISANKAHWVEPGASLDANLQKASKEFFLGFASDFCAFIEGDFIAYDADAEGRMFVGGDLIFNGNSEVGEWNYQVGAGDYGHFDPISQTDEYGDLTGFASGIIGGKVYRLGTMGTGASSNLNAAPPLTGVLGNKGKRHVNGYDVFLYPEEGAYKRFVVGNLKDSLHLDEDYETMGDGVSKDVPYSTSCNHLYYDSNCAICSSKTDHDYLGNVNELSQFYIYDDVSTILEKTFDTVRARAKNLGEMEAKNVNIVTKKINNNDTNVLILDASDIGDAETAYFKLESWPTIDRVEIIVPPNRVIAHDDYYTPGVETISELDLNIIISCEDETISLKGMTTFVRPSNEELNEEKHQISKRGEDNSTNNHPLSSNIVYNFYNATNINFTNNCNLNGTILAPNADVTSPQRCPGHLSGAMIAKSFEGGLEFGYRPYRGGVDVLGLSAGYEVPVDKVVAGAADNHLPGAIFAVKEGDKILNLFESSEKTDFAVIPSKVDFTGKTLYQAEKVEQNEANIVEDKDPEDVGKTIKAPLTIAAYTDADCVNAIGTDAIPVLGKFYIKTNQKVNIAQNPQIYCDNNPQVVEVDGEDVDYVYTVYLNSPITDATDVTELTVNASTVATSKSESGGVKVNFTPMALSVSETEIELDSGADAFKDITYQLLNLPERDEKITYKYYINNEEIQYSAEGFRVTSAHVGVLSITAEAYYEETENGTPRLIAKASNNVTVTKKNFVMPELTFDVPDSVISGNDLEMSVKGLENITNANVTYYFYNSEGQKYNKDTTAKFSTNNIVGKDLSVRAVVEISDNGTMHTMTLYDTVTVNFPENIGLTVTPSEYVVGVDNNDDIIYTLTNIPENTYVQYYYNDGCVGNSSSYFDNNSYKATYTYNNAKLIGTIPVYAVISNNGLTKNIYFNYNNTGQSIITGKYKQISPSVSATECEIGKEFKVTIPDLPNGYRADVTFYDNRKETKTAWGSGTQEVTFYPQTEGTYEVKVTIKFDNNAEQTVLSNHWVTVKPREVVSGPSTHTGTITFAGTFLPGNNITANLNTDANPNDVEWIVYYYFESNTLASGTGTTASFTPQGVGDITYVFREKTGAEIARKTAKINAEFSIFPNNKGNGIHAIQLAKIGDQSVGTVLEFRVKDLSSNTEKILSNEYIKFEGQLITIDTTTLGNGNFEFYINVRLSGGAETEWNSSFTNSNIVTSYALRSLKRAASVFSTNTLIINGDLSDSEEYDGIKLIVSDYAKDQYSKDAYVVDVKFYSGDELIGTKKGYTVQSETIQSTTGDNQNQTRNYIDINVADIENAEKKPITKFEVIVSEGWLEIGSYIPKVRTKGIMVTKTSGSGFKLAQNESKIIELGNWGEKLESVVLDVYSGGRVKYTLIDTNGAPIADYTGKEVAIDKDGKVKIDGNNLENVSKVEIQAINSDLVVNQYVINKYVSQVIDISGIASDKLVVQNTYTIEELQAPTGYKKTEDKIYVEVTEVVFLEDVVTHNYLTYPAHVKTTIKAYKENEIDTPIFKTEMDVIYRTYVDENDNNKTKVDPYTRIVTIGETEFTVTTDLQNNVTVEAGGTAIISNISSIHEFEYGGKKYCFDPSSKMIVSVPETHITFANTKGILFRKVNDNGAAVKDVQIDLLKNGTSVDTSIWNWLKGTTSEWILEFNQLDVGAIYTFHESNTGGLYERADDIYMVKVDNNTVHYWTGSSTKPANKKSAENPTGYEVIDSTSSSNIIRMKNVPIPGIKPVITKTDMNGNKITVGTGEKDAVFSLYAADGTEILSKFVVTGGQVTLDFSQEPYKVYNPRYIENGYLKPGEYYLKEISAPTGYEPAMAPLHFEVIENSDGTFEAYVNLGGETIKNVMFCNNQYSTNYKVNKMTFHLANGETSIIENPTITEHVADYNHYIQLPEQTKGVVAISIEAVYKEGQTSGEDKIKIVNSKGEKIWGDSPDGYDGNAPYCPVNGNRVYHISAEADSTSPISAAATASVDELDTTNVTKGITSLMAFAMKQTGIRVLADVSLNSIGNVNVKGVEKVVVFDANNNSELFNKIKNGQDANVASLLQGKNVTKVEFALDKQNGQIKIGSTSVYFANASDTSTGLSCGDGSSWDGNTLVSIPKSDGNFHGVWNGKTPANNITTLSVNGWGAILSSVKVYYEESSDDTETKITLNAPGSVEIGDNIELSTNITNPPTENYTIKYYINNNEISNNTPALNSYVQNGTITITAKALNSSNTVIAEDTAAITVNVMAFENTNQTVSVGSKFNLNLTNRPNGYTIKYYIGEQEINSDSTVSGDYAGQTIIITAKATKDGDTDVIANANVTVPSQDALSISLSDYEVCIGETVNLTIQNGSITSSRNTDTAEIIDSDTKVVAKQAGDFVITAKANGSEETQSVTLTVLEMKLTAPETVKIGENINLSIENQPTSDYTIKYYINNNEFTNNSPALESYVQNGKITITVKATKEGKPEVSATAEINVEANSEEPETPETPETPDVPLIISPGGNDIKIKNKEIGNVMKLKVEKKWAGDRGITEFRKTVTIQLKRKTVNADGTIKSETGADANGFIECNPYIVDGTPTGGVATLTEANDWQYIWENLPMYVNDNESEGLYYYTVAEANGANGYTSEVETVDENGVKVPLSFNQGGTITVTNTADTVDIPIQKLWSYAGYNKSDVFITNSIKVKLQAKIDGVNWTDLPGKTLTLTSKGCTEDDANKTVTYYGEFKGLPKGYEYRIVEVNTTYGWDDTYPTQEVGVKTDGTLYKMVDNVETECNGFEVENTFNVDKGSLKLQKYWDGETGTRPYSVMLQLYRSSVAPSYTETDAPYTDENITSGTTYDYKDDYKRLLQHSLYFYDANMCGDDVYQNSALAWRTNCHVGDEVPGGYHDAGDHVMFGLPQGYTASMLSWIYLEFFKDNTTTNDDNGADKNSDQYYKMYNEEANHLETILKRFYEFFENSVEYGDDGKITKILVQKGDGEGDHVEWCAPEHQSEDTRIMIWSEYGSDIAYEYAAALALGYLNFGDEDYLNLAEKLYEFAEGTGPYSNSFYPQGSGDGDDKALAAAWIYKAKSVRNNPDLDSTDNKKKYLDARTTEAGKLEWDGVYLAAAAATAYDTGDWSTVTAWIDSKYIGNDYYYVHDWGTARFNAMAQTATLIAAKHVSDKKNTYLEWVVGQMNQLLGDNDWKDEIVKNSTASSAYGECNNGTIDTTGKPICLVTNFVPEGFDVDTPQAAHHRAASGWDTHEEYRLNCGYDEDGYTLIGALAGGPAFAAHDPSKQVQMAQYNHDHPTSAHVYIDDLHDYCCNEVAIDYNSGLVGAAAGLYYFYGTGARSTMIEGVEYGSYGLTGTPNSNLYGDESEVDGVITSTPSAAAVDVENLETYPKAFAFNPTAISINEDIMNGQTSGTIPFTTGLNFDTDIPISIPVELQKYVDSITISFNGKGNGPVYINGNNNHIAQYNTDQSTTCNISVNTNVTSIKLGQWYSENLSIASIVVHWQIPLILTPSKYYLEQGEEFTVDILNNTGDVTWKIKKSDNTLIDITEADFSIDSTGKNWKAGTTANTYTIVGTDTEGKTATFTVQVLGENYKHKNFVIDKKVRRTGKYKFNLMDIPSNAEIQFIKANLSGNMKSDQIVHVIYNGDTEIKSSGKTNCDIQGSGSLQWNTETFADKIPVGQENGYYSFEIWWSDDSTTSVTLSSIDIVYKTDGRELNLIPERSDVRVNEEFDLTINTVGCNITELTAEPSGSVELPETYSNGTYKVKALVPGEVKIRATVDNKLFKIIKLTVKDGIVIDGEEFMDYSDSQVFTVNNTIGNIEWSAENSDDVTVADNVYTIEFKTSDGKEIATFYKKTEKLVTKNVDAEIILRATDDYKDSTDTITIQIKERPKVPHLPNEKFLDEVRIIEITNSNADEWSKEISDLPMYDSKGNPYYYYIEEVAYKLSENDYKPLKEGGYLINSGNTIYMPYVYYNNGIVPVQEGDLNTATVGNKFVSETQGQLPSTGGSGVKTYYYFGGALMLLGIAGFTGLKRRERKRREE